MTRLLTALFFVVACGTRAPEPVDSDRVAAIDDVEPTDDRDTDNGEETDPVPGDTGILELPVPNSCTSVVRPCRAGNCWQTIFDPSVTPHRVEFGTPAPLGWGASTFAEFRLVGDRGDFGGLVARQGKNGVVVPAGTWTLESFSLRTQSTGAPSSPLAFESVTVTPTSGTVTLHQRVVSVTATVTLDGAPASLKTVAVIPGEFVCSPECAWIDEVQPTGMTNAGGTFTMQVPDSDHHFTLRGVGVGEGPLVFATSDSLLTDPTPEIRLARVHGTLTVEGPEGELISWNVRFRSKSNGRVRQFAHADTPYTIGDVITYEVDVVSGDRYDVFLEAEEGNYDPNTLGHPERFTIAEDLLIDDDLELSRELQLVHLTGAFTQAGAPAGRETYLKLLPRDPEMRAFAIHLRQPDETGLDMWMAAGNYDLLAGSTFAWSTPPTRTLLDLDLTEDRVIDVDLPAELLLTPHIVPRGSIAQLTGAGATVLHDPVANVSYMSDAFVGGRHAVPAGTYDVYGTWNNPDGRRNSAVTMAPLVRGLSITADTELTLELFTRRLAGRVDTVADRGILEFRQVGNALYEGNLYQQRALFDETPSGFEAHLAPGFYDVYVHLTSQETVHFTPTEPTVHCLYIPPPRGP